jgi:formamidopyrimidine-DNA glycosylase
VPELIEVEIYRELAARTIGRTIDAVDTPDAWFLRRGPDGAAVGELIIGSTVTDARRRGKLLLVDLDDGPTIGIRFGMTGRLLVDDAAAIERLEYGSNRAEPAWDRFTVRFAGGGSLVVRDPRRLGGVELDPPEDRLGPDAASVGPAALRAVLDRSAAPLKARLMDQTRLAGLGNLLTDEALWRARLDPRRRAGELGDDEVRRLQRAIRTTVRTLTARGGSHTGDLQAARHRGARCPRCGVELRRDAVGGRTTYWCPAEQR